LITDCHARSAQRTQRRGLGLTEPQAANPGQHVTVATHIDRDRGSLALVRTLAPEAGLFLGFSRHHGLTLGFETGHQFTHFLFWNAELIKRLFAFVQDDIEFIGRDGEVRMSRFHVAADIDQCFQ
jgi:hypothetical protein